MRKENIEFLEANRHHYNTLVNAGYVQHLDQATRQRMLDIIHEEFNPGYIGTLWCPPCVADMIKYVYVQYEKWIVANKATEPVAETTPVPTVEPERDHVPMTFPIQDPPEETKPEPPAPPEDRIIKEGVIPNPPKVGATLFGQQKGNVKPVSDAKPVGGPPPAGSSRHKRRR